MLHYYIINIKDASAAAVVLLLPTISHHHPPSLVAVVAVDQSKTQLLKVLIRMFITSIIANRLKMKTLAY